MVLLWVIERTSQTQKFYNMTLYSVYGMAKLEYVSIIGNPLYKCYDILIERVQRRFLKCIYFKTDGTYPERGIPYSCLTMRLKIFNLDFGRKCT